MSHVLSLGSPLRVPIVPLQAKALAEEGLFDLVGGAWGDEAVERAHAHVEEVTLPFLPIDTRAFQLAAEGKLEPGGELETTYGHAAVEVNATLVVMLTVSTILVSSEVFLRRISLVEILSASGMRSKYEAYQIIGGGMFRSSPFLLPATLSCVGDEK